MANSYCLPNEKEKGLDLGTLVGLNPIDKILNDNPLIIFEDTDVIIDFTVPEASILHVEKAATFKIPIVIGTTGFSNKQFDKIKSFSNKIPIVYSANFSVGITIMKKLINDATKNLGSDWEIEIFEAHHNKKVDSPSGTALLLGSAAAKARGKNLDDIIDTLPDEGRDSGAIKEARTQAMEENATVTKEMEKELVEAEGEMDLALRVAVRPGGCSGYSYEMFFDSETEADDISQFYGDVRVVSDSMSAQLLEGATLDFKDGLMGSGFAIDNPNAQRTCGCGNSFS